jgi:hypothetical protein
MAALASNKAVVKGPHLRIDRAAVPSRGAGVVCFEPRRSVFLGNLAFDVDVQTPTAQRMLLALSNDCPL